jgi:hypothetical protein
MLRVRPEVYMYVLLVKHGKVSYNEIVEVNQRILDLIELELGHVVDGSTIEAFDEFRDYNRDILTDYIAGFELKADDESMRRCRDRVQLSFEGIRDTDLTKELSRIIKSVINEMKFDSKAQETPETVRVLLSA